MDIYTQSSTDQTVDTFCSTLYVCECGYSTINKSNANKHVKTNKCAERTISKKKINFKINDDQILSFVKDPNRSEGIMDLEPCSSGESNLSDVSESTDVIKEEQSCDIPGMICYMYDKTYAKRAFICTVAMGKKNTMHDYYKNLFRDPDVVSIYTPDIREIAIFVKDAMRKNNMMDDEHAIHGPESIRKFVEYVSDYNMSRWST